FLLVNALLITLIFFRSRDRPPAEAISLALVGSCAALVAMTFGLQIGDFVTGVGLWTYNALYGSSLVVWLAGIVHLVLVFPGRGHLFTRRPRLVAALYLAVG